MKNFFSKIKSFTKTHKTMSVIIIIIILIAGYSGYKKITSPSGATRYLTATVTKGTIISSITGSGQVSASSEINITPTVSGTITGVSVSPGDQVKQGQTLFTIDSATAQKAVRDAEVNLQSAELSLQTAQAQNGNTDTNQQTSVANAYNALLNSNFEAIPVNSNQVKTTTDLTAPQITGNYSLGKEGVINLHFYSSNGGISFQASGLVQGTSIANTSITEPIGNSGLFLSLPNSAFTTPSDWVINIPNKNASNYLSNYNTYQSALQSQNQTNSNSNINQLSLQSQELAVTKAKNALQDAKDNLANYYIRAPFSGVIASVPVLKGNTASSGTTLGTIITPQQVAIMSLNEVDVAKVQLGQKTR